MNLEPKFFSGALNLVTLVSAIHLVHNNVVPIITSHTNTILHIYSNIVGRKEYVICLRVQRPISSVHLPDS